MTTQAIRQLLNEIDELQQKIDDGAKAWSEGKDPHEMAGCDQSDQYVISNQIEDLWKQVYELAKGKV